MSFMMRFLAVSLLLLSTLLDGASAIFEDEVGLHDWYQQYVGAARLAVFQTSGQRKRLFVATESNAVACLNLRTGQLVWRRTLQAHEAVSHMAVTGKYLVTYSPSAGLVRAWSVVDGALGWDTSLPRALGAAAQGTCYSNSSSAGAFLLPTVSVELASSEALYVLHACHALRILLSNGVVSWASPVNPHSTSLLLDSSSSSSPSLLAIGLDASRSTAHVTRMALEKGDVLQPASIPSLPPLDPASFTITSDGFLIALGKAGQSIYSLRLTPETQTKRGEEPGAVYAPRLKVAGLLDLVTQSPALRLSEASAGHRILSATVLPQRIKGAVAVSVTLESSTLKLLNAGDRVAAATTAGSVELRQLTLLVGLPLEASTRFAPLAAFDWPTMLTDGLELVVEGSQSSGAEGGPTAAVVVAGISVVTDGVARSGSATGGSPGAKGVGDSRGLQAVVKVYSLPHASASPSPSCLTLSLVSEELIPWPSHRGSMSHAFLNAFPRSRTPPASSRSRTTKETRSQQQAEGASGRASDPPSSLEHVDEIAAAFGFRVVMTSDDHALSLLQQSQVVWDREECLASIKDAAMADLPQKDGAGAEGGLAAAMEHKVEEWIKVHWLSAKVSLMLATPEEQQLLQQTRANTSAKNAMHRDRNGFRKLLLLLTESGKMVALHSGNGRVVWSWLLTSAKKVPASVSGGRVLNEQQHKEQGWVSEDDMQLEWIVEVQDGHALVLGRRKATAASAVRTLLLLVDTFTGAEVGRVVLDAHLSLAQPLTLPVTLPKSSTRADPEGGASSAEEYHHVAGHSDALLLVEDASEKGLPTCHVLLSASTSKEAFLAAKSRVSFYAVDKEAGTVTGYALGEEVGGTKVSFQGGTTAVYSHGSVSFSVVEAWRMVLPAGLERIEAVTGVRQDEAVYTQTRVLGDRGAAFRFVSKNLLFIATASCISGTENGAEGASATACASSSLNAYLVDTVSGRVVEKVQHDHAMGPVHAVLSENWVVYHYASTEERRYQVSVIELERQGWQPSTEDVARYALGIGSNNLSSPVASSWHLPPLTALTQSYFFPRGVKGMAVTETVGGITAKHILVATDTDQLYALDKRFVDPRRVKVPTPQEREAGIIPYEETLPLNPLAFLSHGHQIEDLRSVLCQPSRLESTALVFAYGLDLFFTRAAPSRIFDSLTSDFNHLLLLGTIVALLVAILVTWFLARRKELRDKWM